MHVGQDDLSPAQARALVGPERIVGRSTHEPAQAAEALADPDVDYFAVGPVHATPTKPGRPAAGLDYVSHVAQTNGKPWFAIGGLDASNVHEVTERGATRIVVVRAITERRGPRGRGPRAAGGAVTHHDVPRRHRADADLYNASAPSPDHMRRGYARSRARADAIRAELQPLAPGERPLGIKLAVALAVALALANVVALIAGHDEQLVAGPHRDRAAARRRRRAVGAPLLGRARVRGRARPLDRDLGALARVRVQRSAGS